MVECAFTYFLLVREVIIMTEILKKLIGGDLRSIGNVEEVISDVYKDESLFADVFDGMLSENALIRMRAADAIEKISRIKPAYLQSFKIRLINDVSQVEQQEVRWHVAQMLPRLELEKEEIPQIFNLLIHWIEISNSRIVKVNSLQALADMAEKYTDLKPLVINKVEEIITSGSPAMVSRGKILIRKLSKND